MQFKEENYKLVEQIGRGASSWVYSCLDLVDKTEKAIKKIRKEEGNTQRNKKLEEIFNTEVNNLKSCQQECDYVVKSYDHYTTPDYFCIVMEYCKNGTLQDKIRNKFAKGIWETNKEMEVCNILKCLLNGLNALHSKKIIHRDLKPGNIFIHETQGYKIGDFGLSKKCVDMLATSRVGTLFYMAPEILKDEGTYYNHKVDFWSAGVILYEVIFGQRPYGNSPACIDYKVLYKEINEQNELIWQNTINNSPMPDIFKSLLLKMLQRDPAKRIDSNSEEIKDFLRGSSFITPKNGEMELEDGKRENHYYKNKQYDDSIPNDNNCSKNENLINSTPLSMFDYSTLPENKMHNVQITLGESYAISNGIDPANTLN